jgi:Uma2 family endonuclease
MSIKETLSLREIYYQKYPQEEDYMEGMRHDLLVDYLKSLLRWYYRFAQVTLTADLLFILDDVQAVPDIAVIKDVYFSEQQINQIDSWLLHTPNRPTPNVVFEICSKGSWTVDVGEGVEDKPNRYGQFGIPEYYAYDPVGYWGTPGVQLRAWQLANGQMIERQPDAQGRFWSNELNCYLVPDGWYLRLYDAEGNRFLTEGQDQARRAAQAEAEKIQAEIEKEQAEIEKEQATQRAAQREAERARQAEFAKEREAEHAAQAELAKAQAEAEEARAKAETERVKKELEELKAKLRANQIDPDTLK